MLKVKIRNPSRVVDEALKIPPSISISQKQKVLLTLHSHRGFRSLPQSRKNSIHSLEAHTKQLGADFSPILFRAGSLR